LRGLLTWEQTGKEMMISDFTDTNSLSLPVSILQEPNKLHLATAHANRLLHVHLHLPHILSVEI